MSSQFLQIMRSNKCVVLNLNYIISTKISKIINKTYWFQKNKTWHQGYWTYSFTNWFQTPFTDLSLFRLLQREKQYMSYRSILRVRLKEIIIRTYKYKNFRVLGSFPRLRMSSNWLSLKFLWKDSITITHY